MNPFCSTPRSVWGDSRAEHSHSSCSSCRGIYELGADVCAAQALSGSGSKGAQLARDTFEEARSSYHPIAAKMTAADLSM